jgi:hypothetical protein
VKNRKPNLQKRIFNLILIIKSDGNARLHSDQEGIGGGFSVRRLRGQLSTSLLHLNVDCGAGIRFLQRLRLLTRL